MSPLAQYGERELLSVREAAHRLGVSRRTLERLVNRREFPPPLKIGTKSLYATSDLKAYVEKLFTARLGVG
jgi:excisionase family DNA binding protein